jgi:hypothetical protein
MILHCMRTRITTTHLICDHVIHLSSRIIMAIHPVVRTACQDDREAHIVVLIRHPAAGPLGHLVAHQDAPLGPLAATVLDLDRESDGTGTGIRTAAEIGIVAEINKKSLASGPTRTTRNESEWKNQATPCPFKTLKKGQSTRRRLIPHRFSHKKLARLPKRWVRSQRNT